MAQEDKKNRKGVSSKSNEPLIQAIQEILSSSEESADLESSSRLEPYGEVVSLDRPPSVSPSTRQETAADFPARRPVSPAGKGKSRIALGRAARTFMGTLYSILINVFLFAVTFFVLNLVMRIPGFTACDRLYFYSETSIELLNLPLWFNIGCAISAVAILIRLIINSPKYRLGLIIGIPVSLTTLLSNSMEGYVGNGVLFGFGTSVICLILLVMKSDQKTGLKDVNRISFVAGLSILAIVGPALHFFAALIIGFLIALCTKAILSFCLLIGR